MSTIQIISDKKTPIDSIYHLSDIHIRLFHRHEEYKEIFEKTFDILSKFPKKNNLIVVTGDILHSKIELSPECETVTIDFLSSLSDLYPTLFIAGNHDALLNNRCRMDSLSSILYRRNKKNLYYLKDTGIYQYNNVHFYVDSLLDDDSIDMTVPPKMTDFIPIALFHGSLHGWQNTKGYVSDHGEKYVKDFLGMEYVLLGDIHMHQYMSQKKPICAYAGSLISQNFGETDENHGFMIWNLKKKNQEYVRVENRFRYQEVYLLENNRMLTDKKEYTFDTIPIASNGRVKVFGTEDEIKSRVIFTNMKTKWKNVTFYYQSIEEKDVNTDLEITENQTEEENIRNYVREGTPTEYFDDIFESIMKCYQEYNNYTAKLQWKILKLQFSNMFGYGPDNEICFSKNFRNQVIGIFGQNSSGKSTLIDIITMLLFDKTTRFSHGQSIPKEVIHFHEKEACGTIELLIGNDIYKIHKKYKRGEKIKQTTKFHVIRNGKEEELTQEQRKKTNKFIEEMIGNFEMFIYTHCFLQQRENSFREMLPSTKKKFLNDLYGFHWFEKMEKDVKERIKETETRIKVSNEQLTKKSNFSITEEVRLIQSDISSIVVSIQNKNETKNQLNKELERLYESLRLGVKYTTFVEDLKQFETKIQQSSSTITMNKKNQKEMKLFLNQWRENDFVGEWKNYHLHPFFMKWSPVNSSLEKWNDFYHNLCQIQNENIDNIKNSLKMFYKNVSEEEFVIDETVLSMYPLHEKESIENFVKTFKSKSVNESLRECYNNLQHSISDLRRNTLWKEQNTTYKKDTSNLEKEIQCFQKKLVSYEKYTVFLKEENVKIFLSSYEKWKNNSLFQTYSPYFSNEKDKWTNFQSSIYIDNVSEIRNEVKKVEESLLSFDNNICSYSKEELVSRNEYKKMKEIISSPPLECPQCNFVVTDLFQESIIELKELESFLFNIQNDINFLENNLKECHFEPNPDCSVCLKNPDYENRLLWNKKLSLKKKELKKKKTQQNKIFDRLHMSMKKVQDVHIDYYFQQKPTLENLIDFVKKKETCIEKCKKERKEYNICCSKVDNYEKFLKYDDIMKQKNLLIHKKNSLQKKMDHFYFCMEHKNMFDYIQTQWKWFDELPKSMDEIQTIFQALEDDHENIKEKIMLLKNQLFLKNKEWKDFDEKWKKDVKTFKEISLLETSLEKYDTYQSFLQEVSKKEKQDMNIFYRREIKTLEKKQEDYYLWKENERLIVFLERIWKDKSLWKINGNEITNQIQETDITLKKLETDTILLENNIQKLKQEKMDLEKNWKHDEKIHKTIQELKDNIHKEEQDIHSFEERKIELKIKHVQLEAENNNWESVKQELYNLQEYLKKEQLLLKMIDKDGLPLFLLKQKMKQMETNMNQLIKHFLPEKEIRFLLENKVIQFGTINKTDTSILCNYFGGMESFIIDLALKLTFTKFGVLPSSNFFIIDEGISVLDQQRQHNIVFLFDFLSSITDNVLLISHIPQIRDFVNKSIHIQKTNDKSHVKFFLEKK